ncbi:MAG: biopolymer transporter ExbD [Candidatus Omnitrophota bacterium]
MSLRKVRYRTEALADVNMTNLIDVVMVLLISFILVSNFVQTGLDIQVPEVGYVTATGKEKIIVGVDQFGKISVNGAPINKEELVGKLKGLKADYPEEEIFIRVDKRSLVENFAFVSSGAKEAGFNKIMLPMTLLKQEP